MQRNTLKSLKFELYVFTAKIKEEARQYEITEQITEEDFNNLAEDIASPPCFLNIDSPFTMTIAIDEDHMTWVLRGKCIDLKPYGFQEMFQKNPLQ